MSDVFAVLVMLAFLVGGVAFAVDFRGIATEQGRRAVAASRPVRRIVRRGNLTDEEVAKRAARLTIGQRITGAAIALLMLFILGLATVNIFTAQ